MTPYERRLKEGFIPKRHLDPNKDYAKPLIGSVFAVILESNIPAKDPQPIQTNSSNETSESVSIIPFGQNGRKIA